MKRAKNTPAQVVKPTWIYFFQGDSNNSPIKIGRAANIGKRLAEVQTGNPWKQNVLYAFWSDGDVEALIHKRFRKHRLNGEWFRPVPRIYDLIDDIDLYMEGCDPDDKTQFLEYWQAYSIIATLGKTWNGATFWPDKIEVRREER